MGSQTFPTKEWLHLGTFEATYAKREQLFLFPDPKYVRYLKVRFNTHHGDEASCTVSQLKVHGITVMEGMQDDLRKHQEELDEQMESIGEDLPDEEVTVVPTDRKEAAEVAAAKAVQAQTELEAAEAALAVEEVRNRTLKNASNVTLVKNASVGSRVVAAVVDGSMAVVDAVLRSNKTEVVEEPVAPAVSTAAPVVAVLVKEPEAPPLMNTSNTTLVANATNATNATLANVTAPVLTNATLNTTVSVNATNATVVVANATRANATVVNVTLTPQQRCDYAGDFRKFKTQMLSKSKGRDAAPAVGTGTQFESVFKTLMDKIRAFEISHSIYELYLGHLQACYASTVERLDKRLDDEVSKLRADLAHVLDRPRRRWWRPLGRRR